MASRSREREFQPETGKSPTSFRKPKARMAASRGQHPRRIPGAPRGGIPGEGPHRLAQSVLPLQVPEHVLGAVGPVLVLQVPQEDPGGYEETGQRWESLNRPLARPPPGSPPRPRSRLPPAAASARPLLMAFPAASSENRTLQLLGATAASGDEKGGPQKVIGGRGSLREAQSDPSRAP